MRWAGQPGSDRLYESWVRVNLGLPKFISGPLDMPSPLLSLILFAIASVLAAAAFWPRRGWIARIRRVRRQSERVQVEDALKHLTTQELDGQEASLSTLAGTLEVSRNEVARVLAHLEEMELARTTDRGVSLTASGREYGMRILRTHRLWERYLADRTGIRPTEWHEEAERVEHLLTAADAEKLSTRLGHPLYDPHGDPIPMRSGDMPPLSGVPLSSLEVGAVAVVRHVEDEPEAVFERIASQGIVPGLELEVVDSVGGTMRVRASGSVTELDSLALRNVTVELREAHEVGAQASCTLADIPVGASATVVRLAPACQGVQRRRLMDLGVVPDTAIDVERASMTGDPLAYRIRGALIALRKEQARVIEVEPAAMAEEA